MRVDFDHAGPLVPTPRKPEDWVPEGYLGKGVLEWTPDCFPAITAEELLLLADDVVERGLAGEGPVDTLVQSVRALIERAYERADATTCERDEDEEGCLRSAADDVLLVADAVVDLGLTASDAVDMLVQAVRALLEPAEGREESGRDPLPELNPLDADVKFFDDESTPT